MTYADWKKYSIFQNRAIKVSGREKTAWQHSIVIMLNNARRIYGQNKSFLWTTFSVWLRKFTLAKIMNMVHLEITYIPYYCVVVLTMVLIWKFNCRTKYHLSSCFRLQRQLCQQRYFSPPLFLNSSALYNNKCIHSICSVRI